MSKKHNLAIVRVRPAGLMQIVNQMAEIEEKFERQDSLTGGKKLC